MPVPVSIVEDDSAVRKTLAEWINEGGGFQCLSQHPNGESALAELPGKRPGIVLMDVNLPDVTGIDCVRRLKPVLPATHFVMLTVYEDSRHVFDSLAAGAVGYLLKQTPCSQLIKSLEQVCHGGSPMSGYVARKVVGFFQEFPAENHLEFEALTPKERKVIELLSQGFLYKEITDSMGISLSTVNGYVRRIYEKLHVHSRTQATVKYLDNEKTRRRSPAGL